MASTSHIVIDHEALTKNISFVRGLVGKETLISAVVKGNAYGHGTGIVIPALEAAGINHFSVYSSAEAIEAYPLSDRRSTIMIMGYVDPGDLEWIIRRGVEFFVSDPELLEEVIRIAAALNTAAMIHLDLETGMYRTGLTLKQLGKVIKTIRQREDLVTIKGVASHFAGAESIANHQRIKKQLSVFKRRVAYLEEQGVHTGLKHIASSAATINYPESRMDLVRTGILIYGYWPTRETFINYLHRRKDKTDPLFRALSWYSRVMLVKQVPEGQFIGYGLNFQATHKMRIMVVPVGYCNGYSRSLSNNGHVIVHGQRSPVIGIINMNMIICDITDIPEVKRGDRVTLIGRQDDLVISFSSFAEMNNALNYEILARLPENIDRTIIQS